MTLLISVPLALCSLTLSELNGLFDELGIASDLDAQKAVHRILYMLGEGLDHDKLNDMLRNGTLALKFQANFGSALPPVQQARAIQARWHHHGEVLLQPSHHHGLPRDVPVRASSRWDCTPAGAAVSVATSRGCASVAA